MQWSSQNLLEECILGQRIEWKQQKTTLPQNGWKYSSDTSQCLYYLRVFEIQSPPLSCIVPLGQWISHIVIIWEYMASLWREKYVTNKAREDYFILKSLLVAVIRNIRYSDFEIWKTIEFWSKITGILLRIAERTVLFNLSLNPSSDGERNSLVS